MSDFCGIVGTLLVLMIFVDIAFSIRARGNDVGATHRERHEFLHRQFDELLGDFLAHNRQAYPSQTTIGELMEWSHRQTSKPDELSKRGRGGFLGELYR